MMAVFFGCVGLILFAGRHKPPAITLPHVQMTNNNLWFKGAERPTLTPTPPPHVTVTQKIIEVQKPPPTPAPQPMLCEICVERERRYRMALETGFPHESENFKQIPRVNNAKNPSLQPNPYSGLPTVFADSLHVE
jgi:hypothetical protein